MAGVTDNQRKAVGLPIRPFLYTPDQIATLLGESTKKILNDYLFYDGLEAGVPKRTQMRCRDIASDELLDKDVHDWRVTEMELYRWLRRMRFRIFDTGWIE